MDDEKSKGEFIKLESIKAKQLSPFSNQSELAQANHKIIIPHDQCQHLTIGDIKKHQPKLIKSDNYQYLASFLQARYEVMGVERVEAGKGNAQTIDHWTQKDEQSIHFAMAEENMVASGANVHKLINPKTRREEYQISLVFTIKEARQFGLSNRLIANIVNTLRKDDDKIIFLNSRCSHDLLDAVDPEHTKNCPYSGNQDSQVRHYEKLGFKIDFANLDISCHSGIGNIRMVFKG